MAEPGRPVSPAVRERAPGPADERRPITIRLPNETLASLQFVSAAIRRSSGAAMGSSAIVRGLISWLSETDLDTRRIRTPEELLDRLLDEVRELRRRPRG